MSELAWLIAIECFFYGFVRLFYVNYFSAEAWELPDSTTDICLYGYIPDKPEVAISTGVNSDCTSPTFISPIFNMFMAAFRSLSMLK